jgi:hypothetical protein
MLLGLTYLATRGGESTEDAQFFAQNPIYNVHILDGLETLFQSHVNSNETKKLSRIRIDDINAFHAFVVLCLRHTVGVMTWKLKHRKFDISDIFSVSDEALALVVLENNAMVWKNKAYGTDTVVKAKYMKTAKDGSVRKDWSDEGKERFNDVFCQVKDLRLTSLSATNEKALRHLWNQSTRKQRQGEVPSTTEAAGDSNRARVSFIYEG